MNVTELIFKYLRYEKIVSLDVSLSQIYWVFIGSRMPASQNL